MKKRIPENKWKWYGSAAHLCVASMCRFHITTLVGNIVVSTVGEFYEKPNDARPTEIGLGRLYETMAFKQTGMCSCGCGLPTVSGLELLCEGYNHAEAANRGHLKICRMAANGEIE